MTVWVELRSPGTAENLQFVFNPQEMPMCYDEEACAS